MGPDEYLETVRYSIVIPVKIHIEAKFNIQEPEETMNLGPEINPHKFTLNALKQIKFFKILL
jgi:hypothetical protein